VRIWQEAGKKSSQWATGFEPELGLVLERRTGPLKTKKGQARPLKENRGGRGRCGAGKLYLVDVWSNSDFEFSQEVNALNGTSHSGLKKTGCKEFALELDGFSK
jgi:hypothetical protein